MPSSPNMNISCFFTFGDKLFFCLSSSISEKNVCFVKREMRLMMIISFGVISTQLSRILYLFQSLIQSSHLDDLGFFFSIWKKENNLYPHPSSCIIITHSQRMFECVCDTNSLETWITLQVNNSEGAERRKVKNNRTTKHPQHNWESLSRIDLQKENTNYNVNTIMDI